MEWSEIYLTGNKDIDKQHRELFDIISQFKDTFSENSISNVEVGKILKYLVNYSKFHFATEEDYLERIGYMKLEEHKHNHEIFVIELKDILNNLKSKGFYRPIQLYYFLTKWLKNHIGIEDQKYVKANGEIKILKTTLDNPESILPVITANLSRIEYMAEDKQLTLDEKTEKRISYLHSYYDTYKTENCKELYSVLESLSLLSSRKIISRNEDLLVKKYVSANIPNIKELIDLETDKDFKEEITNYLTHYNLI